MSWLTATITGALALITAVVVAILQVRASGRIKILEASLAEKAAESSAKRAYEYEALKRLYTSARPLLFQIGELCEISNRRIDKVLRGIIRLRANDGLVLTTAYRIVAPLVLTRALNDQLTTVDLRLDPELKGQYLVAREMLYTFQNGYDLADAEPAVDLRKKRPDGSRGPRQVLTVGYLDELIEAATTRGSDGARQLKPFRRFEEDCTDTSGDLHRLVARPLQIIGAADPGETPVLWRALVAQRLLQHRLLTLLEADGFPASDVLPSADREPYGSALEKAFVGARAYLHGRGID